MENQRVRMSKKLLKEALLELLSEKPVGKITVYELCNKAEINRTTFYKYYGSPYELLCEIENDYFKKLEECLACSDSNDDNGLISATKFLDAERKQWCILINAVPDEDFTRQLFNLPIICKLTNEHLKNEKDEIKRNYIRLFVCHGGYAIIRHWLNSNEQTPEEVAAIILQLITRAIE